MNLILLAQARAAVARGWLVTTLRGKIPSTRGWTTAPQMTDGEIHSAVYAGANIGVRTGNDLIVVDTDPGADPELLKKLEAIRTPTVRTGRDGRHFYFRGNGKCSVGKISDHVDVRGDGGQVVGVGSIHPDTGLPYTWIITPEEAELAPYPPWIDEMTRAAKKIRKAPAGKRNDTLNKAAFAAAKAGAPTRELANAATDAGLEQKEIEATIDSATRAAPKFAPKFDQNEILVPGEHFFTSGEVVTMDQTKFAECCWNRIPDDIFVSRFGVPGVIQDGVFVPNDIARFRVVASQYLPLYAWVKDGRVCVKEYRVFSADMGSIVMAASPEYTKIVEAITFYPVAGGMHPGWLIIGDHPISPVFDHATFWRELLIDFPFKSDHDRWVFVAILLTLIMRPMIHGSTPPFMISASRERTGKTKLVTDVLACIYGRDVANIAFSDDDTELDKRLVSRAFSGHTILFFDNIRGKINSAVFAAYCTSRVYSSRILGQSKTVEFPVNAITVLTANNPSMSGEIAKRMLVCRLESPVDRPEMRTDFKYPDIREHLAKNRPAMLGSLLAIAEMLPTLPFIMGGYEEWARVVGGRMAAAGMPLSQEAFISGTEEANDEDADIRLLIQKWSLYPEYVTAEQILLLVKEMGVMGFILEATTERGQVNRMARQLRLINGRVFGEWKVTAGGVGSRRNWKLVQI